MVKDIDSLRQLSIGSLAARCGQETEAFFHNRPHDPRFCFEMFRRAAQEDSQRAWELLHKQYHSLIHGWILRHPAFGQTGEEVSFFLNRALERLWGALKGDKFDRFNDLSSILRYLQICVHSVILDRLRRDRHAEMQLSLEDGLQVPDNRVGGLEHVLAMHEAREELWRHVQGRLKDAAERAVIYDNFVLDLKSRQKYERHRELFGSVEDVYRIKQNIMARLRRDNALAEMLQAND